MRNILIVLTFFTVLASIPPAGCRCSDYEVESFNVFIGTGYAEDTILLPTDTVWLVLDMNWHPISKIYQNTTNPFLTSAYAFCSSTDIGIGIKDIKISSNKNFNDVAAGSSLEEKLICPETDGTYIDDCIRAYLHEGLSTLEGVIFMFKEAPSEPEHIFTVRLTTDNDELLYATSDTVVWAN